ncbi:hypothetical protein JJQ72_12815 [Paenibacillus sp. F411]|uniref:hypothetical protein n=1 Tax=Paenibacillus sp. F411 TaxID=2820239 RepID=UPI001AAF9A97|nr:hypothetical protein [Paenibacillus sp. F411]MBO2944854.1 hypothetical protein [Paenibacillus sp. F411]
MVAHLLGILITYAAAVALVHGVHARYIKQWQGRRRAVHYVLVTSNHERQVEWIVRALSLYALLSGVRVKATMLDEQSADETLAIMGRMQDRAGIELVWVNMDEDVRNELKHELRSTSRQDDDSIYIDLRMGGEGARIPYW